MPLEFPEPEANVPPQDPNPLAHQANEEADYAIDAANSFEARMQRVQKIRSEPTLQKLENTPKNLIIISGILSLVYLLVVFIEWHISREIYEVIWPGLALAIYACCVGFCFWISVCFGETSQHFSLELNNRKRDSSAARAVSSVISSQYDQAQGPRPIATECAAPFA